MKVVLKVQRPLASNVENPPYLAYDEKRRILRELPETWQLRELFKTGEAKLYVEAEVIGNAISLGRRVRPQPW